MHIIASLVAGQAGEAHSNPLLLVVGEDDNADRLLRLGIADILPLFYHLRPLLDYLFQKQLINHQK